MLKAYLDRWINGYVIVYACVYGSNGKESGQEFGSLEHMVLQSGWLWAMQIQEKANGLHPYF